MSVGGRLRALGGGFCPFGLLGCAGFAAAFVGAGFVAACFLTVGLLTAFAAGAAFLAAGFFGLAFAFGLGLADVFGGAVARRYSASAFLPDSSADFSASSAALLIMSPTFLIPSPTAFATGLAALITKGAAISANSTHPLPLGLNRIVLLQPRASYYYTRPNRVAALDP